MYQFRKAKIEDIAEIVSLVESAYRGETSRNGWTTEADLLDGQRTDHNEISSLIRQPDSEIILCEEQTMLLASVHIVNKTSSAYLGMFAVDPQQQGKGIGKAVLSYVESQIKNQWSCKSIEMTVIKQRNELIRWYQKRGYEITGELRDFPYGNENYGIPRRDDLQLKVLKKYL